jgi:hypothetical protein
MELTLQSAANIADILTPVAGILVWLSYKMSFYRKKKRLESHLKAKKKTEDRSKRTLLGLTIDTGLTTDELLKASFNSRHIKRLKEVGDDGKTVSILFEYREVNPE